MSLVRPRSVSGSQQCLKCILWEQPRFGSCRLPSLRCITGKGQLLVPASCVACCSVKLVVFSIMHAQRTWEIWLNPGVTSVGGSISLLQALECGLCDMVNDTLLTYVVWIFFTRKYISEEWTEKGMWCLQWKCKLSCMGWFFALNLGWKDSCVKTKCNKCVTENAIVLGRNER